jgi:hypothetical protein
MGTKAAAPLAQNRGIMTVSTARETWAPTSDDVRALDLLHTADRQRAFLRMALRSGNWLDAYLCECGPNLLAANQNHLPEGSGAVIFSTGYTA